MSEPDWKTKKVLIVDNDAAFVSMAKTALSGVGVSDVRTVASVPEAVKLMAEYPADLVIIEISLPRVNGAQLAKVLRDKWRSPNPDVLIIVVVATSKADALRQACDAGVENFIRKPVSAENLIKRIGSILKRPKRFVSAGGYFGPDRRNPDVIAYSRPERRKAPETVASSQPPSEREARNFDLVEEPDHPPPLDNVSEDDVPLLDAPVPTPPTAEPTVAVPLTDAPMPAVKGTSKKEWSEAVALAEDTVELDTEEPDAALLSVLDEHVTWLRTKGKEGEKAAFTGANLSGVNLAGANLANANLREANLSESDCRAAVFQGSDMRYADLSDAQAGKADVAVAVMRHADMQLAQLQGANLRGTDLSGVNLKGATLTNADLSGATLLSTDLRETDLVRPSD